MTKIFDGREFAREKEVELKEKAGELAKKGVTPKLVSILVGDDPASKLYVNLKKKAGERIGVQVEIAEYDASISSSELASDIEKLNKDDSVHGIMIQLPLPSNFSKKERDSLINTIAQDKDVDGLQDDSPYLTPTAKAVLEVIHKLPLKYKACKVVVVGAGGFEGGKILSAIKSAYRNWSVEGVFDKKEDIESKTQTADVLISVTGSPGIIGSDEVKSGAAIIDVGSPKGDVRTEEVLSKASFISPVPGGVGPVTVSCLLENLVVSALQNAS